MGSSPFSHRDTALRAPKTWMLLERPAKCFDRERGEQNEVFIRVDARRTGNRNRDLVSDEPPLSAFLIRVPPRDTAAGSMQIQAWSTTVQRRADFAPVPFTVAGYGKICPNSSAAGGGIQIHSDVPVQTHVDAAAGGVQAGFIFGLTR